MVLTCCTISSTLLLHLHLTILHNIQTQTTTVSLLQLVNGQYLAVTSNTVLCVSQIMTRCQVLWQLVYTKSFLHESISSVCFALSGFFFSLFWTFDMLRDCSLLDMLCIWSSDRDSYTPGAKMKHHSTAFSRSTSLNIRISLNSWWSLCVFDASRAVDHRSPLEMSRVLAPTPFCHLDTDTTQQELCGCSFVDVRYSSKSVYYTLCPKKVSP